jgi:hypothetical protein
MKDGYDDDDDDPGTSNFHSTDCLRGLMVTHRFFSYSPAV